MLSNKDITKEIIKAKNLAIHPLKLENINGSSINLTASKYAWYSSDRKILQPVEGNKSDDTNKNNDGVTNNNVENPEVELPGKTAVENGIIKIPKGETVNILTEEALWVSRKISGTYHSRVSLSAKGLSNISTTLDPKCCGLSLISITNNSKYEQKLAVGDGIVTLTFDYLNRPASKDHVEIAASRQDIYKRFDMTTLSIEERQYLDSTEHRTPFRIVKNMKDSDTYNELKSSTTFKKFLSHLNKPIPLLVIGGITGAFFKEIFTLIFK